MFRIHGYGEDAFTLWALKHQISKILREFSVKDEGSLKVEQEKSY